MMTFERVRVPDTSTQGAGGVIVYPTLPDIRDFISVTPWHDPATGRRGDHPQVVVAVWRRSYFIHRRWKTVVRAKRYPSVRVYLTAGAAAIQDAVNEQAVQYAALNTAWELDEQISGRPQGGSRK